MKSLRAFLILLVLLFWASCAVAYDNDGHDEAGNNLYSGGPHRAINELAIGAFTKNAATDPLLKFYDFARSTDLRGPKVTARGMEFITEGEGKGTPQWWMIEGGFTADEPELYNSFRHFYDPHTNDGVPYLTDHLDQLDYVYKTFVFGTHTGKIVLFVAGSTVNPQINARDWAISGEKGNSFWENPYSWNKGVGYMRAAFANPKDKTPNFAKAWRSLGETMHLIADMTSVPHVRNDSHPGKGVNWDFDPDRGFLKNDPYELLCSESLVRASAGGGVDPVVGARIKTSTRPEDLFDRVAVYTSGHFFSSDTISGTYIKHKGTPQERVVTVAPANGKPAYLFPRLSECKYDQKTGFFTSVINGRQVKLLHENWTSSVGWAAEKSSGGYSIPLACVREQAAVLIPVAVHANVRLMELFVPRLEVKIASLDLQKREIKGALIHHKQGAFREPLVYNADKFQFFNVYLDGRLQNWDKFKLDVKANEITVNFDESLDLSGAEKLALELDIGGLMIRSADYSLAATISGRVCQKKENLPPETFRNPFLVLEGVPIPGAAVICRFATAKGQQTRTATTDKNGNYCFAVPFGVKVTVTVLGESKDAICTPEKPGAYLPFGWQGHEVTPANSVSTSAEGSIPVPRP